MNNSQLMPTYKTKFGKSLRFPKRIKVEGMDMRSRILHDALVLEGLSNNLLSTVLRLKKDIDKSKVIGNKGGTLSFAQRVLFLIEIGLLPDDSFPKFQIFIELRNAVAHNHHASTYTKAYEAIGKTRSVLEMYPQDKKFSLETQLKRATKQLSGYVLDEGNKLVACALDRISIDEENKILAKQTAFKALVEAIGDIVIYAQEEINKRYATKKPLTEEEVRSLPGFLFEQIQRAHTYRMKDRRHKIEEEKK